MFVSQGLFAVCGILTGFYCCCCLCCCCNCCCGKLKPPASSEGAEPDIVSPDDLEEEIRNDHEDGEMERCDWLVVVTRDVTETCGSRFTRSVRRLI